jgi:hypothetical protein
MRQKDEGIRENWKDGKLGLIENKKTENRTIGLLFHHSLISSFYAPYFIF